MSIEEAERAVADFVKKILKKEGQVIKVEKTDEGWEAEVEVIEENRFVKSLGVPTTVYDRNVYLIRLSHGLEATSYNRLKERPAKAEHGPSGR